MWTVLRKAVKLLEHTSSLNTGTANLNGFSRVTPLYVSVYSVMTQHIVQTCNSKQLFLKIQLLFCASGYIFI